MSGRLSGMRAVAAVGLAGLFLGAGLWAARGAGACACADSRSGRGRGIHCDCGGARPGRGYPRHPGAEVRGAGLAVARRHRGRGDARRGHISPLALAARPSGPYPAAIRDRAAASGTDSRSHAAGERTRILHRGVGYRAQLHRAAIRGCGHPPDHGGVSARSASRPRMYRWPGISRCWENSCISAIS